jgi:hypothetical protein
MDYVEKRACVRCYYEAPVTCASFNSGRFYRAKTTDHSKDGLFFESDFSLKPEASIYIRIDNYLPEASGSGICGCRRIRSLAIDRVKWCKELQGPDGSCYGVGLKYYEPAI